MLMKFRFFFLIFFFSSTVMAEVEVIEARSIALHGKPKYPDNFKHYDYVNPDAPKGGTLRDFSIGTFDSLNRFGQRGVAAIGSGGLYDNLMASPDDELTVYYPLIAEKIQYADDYSFVTFFINPKARFSDGKPITAQDMKFTYNKFMTEGVPQFAKFYNEFVDKVVVEDKYKIKFLLKKGADRDKLISLCGLPVLPEHYWKDHDLSEPLKEVPVGSSSITISDFKFGQYITYKKLENYWGADLPVKVGIGNFDNYRYDYYRDKTVAFEALKAGDIDIWSETEPDKWQTAYDFPALKEGRVVKEEIKHQIPQPTTGFIFNTKKPIFADVRVREALSYALDFQWINKNLFFSHFSRTNSYFQGTKYMARELPSKEELAILEPIKDKIRPEVFTTVFNPPATDGSGNIRANMRKALKLLKEAGWVVKNQKLTNAATGEVFKFELMTFRPATERFAIPFQNNLKKLGIEMTIRQVDVSQFTNRWHEHDFDMISMRYSANPYPSSSLKLVWRSNFVDSTYNQANVTDSAVDYLIDGIVAHQENEDELLFWGRALDRVLMWNNYIIPQWHDDKFLIAYQNKFDRPATRPKYALGIGTWWLDKAKAAKLEQ